MKTIYYVISLPRTGTSSISRMANVVGFTAQHAPHQSFIHNWNGTQGWDFFSDTPTYCPSNIKKVCESNEIDAKFIFIDRNFDEIFNSWRNVKLYDNYKNMIELSRSGNLTSGMKLDFDSYTEAFGSSELTEENYKEIFESHKIKVLDIVRSYNKPLLIYNFNDGWEPFCKFTNTEIPNQEVPHLNEKKIYEKI